MSRGKLNFLEFFEKIVRLLIMENLKTARLAKNLLQKDVAKLLGVTPATYCGWEKGKFEIDNKNLLKLADYFNVTTDYLLGRTSDNIFENSYIPKSEIQEVYDELDELEQAQVLSFAKTLASYKKNSMLSTKRDRNIG